MAREIINTGSLPNDGTGDTLRDAFKKADNNFKKLFEGIGFAFYQDDAASTFTVTTTPTKLTINKLGVANYEGALPLEIRGVGTLWDASSNITPITEDDSYDSRFNFYINNRTSNPKYIILTLDIGGAATITNSIHTERIDIDRAAPFPTAASFPIFCRSTFLANGGQIFLQTDVGSADITNRSVFLKRDISGTVIQDAI